MTGRGEIVDDAKQPLCGFTASLSAQEPLTLCYRPEANHTHLLLANTNFNKNTSWYVCSRQTHARRELLSNSR